jgi:ribosomal protein S18 acetylase RimI-like enzyme
MEIIKANPDHARDIARLNDAVQKLHASHHPDVFKYPTAVSEMESFFRDKIQADDHVVFMAGIDGKSVGYLWCQIQRREENLFKHAMARLYICQLSVDPDHRGNSVGRELMRAAERLARENGIDTMALDSWMFNENAHRFFEKLGFSTFNILMSKDIPEW